MLEKVLYYERDLFFALNGHHTVFWDNVMWLYSGKASWLPLAVFVLLVLIYKKPWRESILIMLSFVLVITLCDQFASHLCKPLFIRPRPTHHPDFMNQVQTVFNYRGGQYGFISSHAANAFGFSTYISLLLRRKLFTLTIIIWAVIMAYTRIYLGVHFISDIVPGAVSGCVFGTLTYYFYVYARKWLLFRGRREVPIPSEMYSDRRVWLITGAIWLTIFTLLVFNTFLSASLR